ncbi:hypothetical protein JOD24_000383 [Kroppenstedtia sanguinis]|uniref:Uncharacterized protein n=1 Tax=Kroppenstedtia sanguinis TaxID=1380684 RepID=A0ABW4CAG1_9BACL
MDVAWYAVHRVLSVQAGDRVVGSALIVLFSSFSILKISKYDGYDFPFNTGGYSTDIKVRPTQVIERKGSNWT